MRWFFGRLLARLGSRTIVMVGGTLFVLNMLIPDPIPLVDEILTLVGTVLLSRWAKTEEGLDEPTSPKRVGRGRTQR
jgi:hypothetical protein